MKNYTYDLAGNLLSDGTSTYTYDAQNRLLTKVNADGTTSYEYAAAGNLVKTTTLDGAVSYTYNAQNKLVKGEKDNGESSSYTYNALGVRIANEQVRINQNAGYRNGDLKDGSHGVDYMDYLKDGRAVWQRAWETEIGTAVQPDMETVTRHYVVDYLSVANRDILVTEDGSYITRYVYDVSGTRLSAEFDYAPGTQRGEGGENLQTDRAVSIGKVWYRTSLLGSTLFAVDADGEVVAHMIYDPWGNPLVETYPDANFSGLENLNNFTGYTWDETLGLYFAQNRFYDAESHRFTQEDVVKDGANWYEYCGNNPSIAVDFTGLAYEDAFRYAFGGISGAQNKNQSQIGHSSFGMVIRPEDLFNDTETTSVNTNSPRRGRNERLTQKADPQNAVSPKTESIQPPDDYFPKVSCDENAEPRKAFGIGISGGAGLALSLQLSTLYVWDTYGNKGILITGGVGGGLGYTYGITFADFPDVDTIFELSGAGVAMGFSVSAVGLEIGAGAEDVSSSSTFGLPGISAEFHATITGAQLIVLQEVHR